MDPDWTEAEDDADSDSPVWSGAEREVPRLAAFALGVCVVPWP